MRNADPDAVARRLADDARPVLGAGGYSDERIDELAYASVNDHIGEGEEQSITGHWRKDPSASTPKQGSDAARSGHELRDSDASLGSR
jgi:hypothetical protein